MSILPRWGYEDWRDVRNDIFLLTCIAKLGSLIWLAHDWWVFTNGGPSRVVGFVIVHFGWDSKITEWVRWLWMLGR